MQFLLQKEIVHRTLNENTSWSRKEIKQIDERENICALGRYV